MASDACLPSNPSSGRSLGDICGRIEALKIDTAELLTAYENDVSVFDLADRTSAIRNNAAALAAVLYDFDNALGAL